MITGVGLKDAPPFEGTNFFGKEDKNEHFRTQVENEIKKNLYKFEKGGKKNKKQVINVRGEGQQRQEQKEPPLNLRQRAEWDK
jgi:hypothetical protein